jgi:hypothetical protein
MGQVLKTKRSWDMEYCSSDVVWERLCSVTSLLIQEQERLVGGCIAFVMVWPTTDVDISKKRAANEASTSLSCNVFVSAALYPAVLGLWRLDLSETSPASKRRQSSSRKPTECALTGVRPNLIGYRKERALNRARNIFLVV